MADLQKLAEALTGANLDIFETIKRDDFNLDDEFFDAAATEQLRRNDPAFSQARRVVIREYRRQQEQQERQQQREDFKAIRSSVRLTAEQTAEISKQAEALAADDLRAGRIGAGGIVSAVERHKKELEGRKLDSMAAGVQFNQMLRGGR